MLAISATGCKKPGEAVASGESAGSSSADTANAEIFATAPEARAWLADPNHAFFEISKEAASKITEDLYAAGAKKVVIADAMPLQEGSPKEIAATFLAELPDDKAQRAAVFKVMNEVNGEDSTKEEGQKYETLTTD